MEPQPLASLEVAGNVFNLFEGITLLDSNPGEEEEIDEEGNTKKYTSIKVSSARHVVLTKEGKVQLKDQFSNVDTLVKGTVIAKDEWIELEDPGEVQIGEEKLTIKLKASKENDEEEEEERRLTQIPDTPELNLEKSRNSVLGASFVPCTQNMSSSTMNGTEVTQDEVFIAATQESMGEVDLPDENESQMVTGDGGGAGEMSESQSSVIPDQNKSWLTSKKAMQLFWSKSDEKPDDIRSTDSTDVGTDNGSEADLFGDQEDQVEQEEPKKDTTESDVEEEFYSALSAKSSKKKIQSPTVEVLEPVVEVPKEVEIVAQNPSKELTEEDLTDEEFEKSLRQINSKEEEAKESPKTEPEKPASPPPSPPLPESEAFLGFQPPETQNKAESSTSNINLLDALNSDEKPPSPCDDIWSMATQDADQTGKSSASATTTTNEDIWSISTQAATVIHRPRSPEDIWNMATQAPLAAPDPVFDAATQPFIPPSKPSMYDMETQAPICSEKFRKSMENADSDSDTDMDVFKKPKIQTQKPARCETPKMMDLSMMSQVNTPDFFQLPTKDSMKSTKKGPELKSPLASPSGHIFSAPEPRQGRKLKIKPPTARNFKKTVKSPEDSKPAPLKGLISRAYSPEKEESEGENEDEEKTPEVNEDSPESEEEEKASKRQKMDKNALEAKEDSSDEEEIGPKTSKRVKKSPAIKDYSDESEEEKEEPKKPPIKDSSDESEEEKEEPKKPPTESKKTTKIDNKKKKNFVEAPPSESEEEKEPKVKPSTRTKKAIKEPFIEPVAPKALTRGRKIKTTELTNAEQTQLDTPSFFSDLPKNLQAISSRSSINHSTTSSTKRSIEEPEEPRKKLKIKKPSKRKASPEPEPTKPAEKSVLKPKIEPQIAEPTRLRATRSKRKIESPEKVRRSASVSSASSSTENLEVKPHVVMFTKIDKPEKFDAKLKSLGFTVTSNPAEATILVAEQIFRTYKFLAALVRGIPIVSLDWVKKLPQSQNDAKKFILRDSSGERKYKFNLKNRLEKASREGLLFRGMQILASPNTKPSPEEIKMIAECSEAEFLTSPTKINKKSVESVLCVANEADKDWIKKIKQKNPEILIVTGESFMASITEGIILTKKRL